MNHTEKVAFHHRSSNFNLFKQLIVINYSLVQIETNTIVFSTTLFDSILTVGYQMGIICHVERFHLGQYL